MVYQNKRNGQSIILDTGFYKNYEYIILNLGTHPCAYICVDSKNAFYQKHYDDVPIIVHGGLTFSNDVLHNVLEYSDKYKCDTLQAFRRDWILGWDYSHLGDYYGGSSSTFDYRKWTTKEIKEEVKYAINQLIDLNKCALKHLIIYKELLY